ncbi:MAG: histidine phosphatase family protein [Candidatus Pacearchaeota archaeon]
MPLQVFLIRHPETISNKEEIIEDPMGGVLSKYGKSQISTAVKRLSALKITRVYSSDSARCKELAEAFSKLSGLPLHYISALREINSGDWIGMKKSDVKKLIAQNKRPKHGEDMHQLMERAKAILQKLSQEEGRILLISHGCLIKMLVGATQNINVYEADEEVIVKNCDILELDLRHIQKSIPVIENRIK